MKKIHFLLLLIFISCNYKGYLHEKKTEPYNEYKYDNPVYITSSYKIGKHTYTSSTYSHTNIVLKKDYEDYIFIFQKETRKGVKYKKFYVKKHVFDSYKINDYVDSKKDNIKLYKFDWNNKEIIIGRK